MSNSNDENVSETEGEENDDINEPNPMSDFEPVETEEELQDDNDGDESIGDTSSNIDPENRIPVTPAPMEAEEDKWDEIEPTGDEDSESDAENKISTHEIEPISDENPEPEAENLIMISVQPEEENAETKAVSVEDSESDAEKMISASVETEEEEKQPLIVAATNEAEEGDKVEIEDSVPETENQISPVDSDDEKQPLILESESKEEKQPLTVESENEEEKRPLIVQSEKDEEKQPFIVGSEAEEGNTDSDLEKSESSSSESENEEEKQPLIVQSETDEEKQPFIVGSETEEGNSDSDSEKSESSSSEDSNATPITLNKSKGGSPLLDKNRNKKLVLSLKAKYLKTGFRRGKADPYATVKDSSFYMGRTESIKNSLDPEWVKTFNLDYELGSDKQLTVNIFDEVKYGPDIAMGSACFYVGEILAAKGNSIALQLKSGGKLIVGVSHQVNWEVDSLTSIPLEADDEILPPGIDPSKTSKRLLDSTNGQAGSDVCDRNTNLDIENQASSPRTHNNNTNTRGEGSNVTFNLSTKQLPFAGNCVFAIFVLVALVERHRLLKVNYWRYGVCFAVFSVFFSLVSVGMVMMKKQGYITQSIDFVLLSWNLVGALVLTNKAGPFSSTNNGYIASWGMVFFSVMINMHKLSMILKSALYCFGLWSILLLISVSPYIKEGKDGRVIYIFIISILTILLVGGMVIVEVFRMSDVYIYAIFSLYIYAIFSLTWFILACIATFSYPFFLTGNGFFASWGGFITSIFLVREAVKPSEGTTTGEVAENFQENNEPAIIDRDLENREHSPTEEI